jgi:hypothetical protein
VCAQYARPNGVAFAFQVSTNKVEPAVPNRALNLLTKDRVRSALADEPEPLGPEVPSIRATFPFARCAERLTGAASRPDGSVLGPSGKTQGEGPSPDAGEGVEGSPHNVGWLKFHDGSLIHDSHGDFARRHQVA